MKRDDFETSPSKSISMHRYPRVKTKGFVISPLFVGSQTNRLEPRILMVLYTLRHRDEKIHKRAFSAVVKILEKS